MAKGDRLIVPNQVFIGCPWKTIRRKYEKAIDVLRRRFPLSHVIIGRGDTQEAEDLLQVIKERLLSSSFAIFDATGGNANVSLEYGLAEAHEISRAIYVSSHAAANRGEDSPIIADLAGKKRNQYAQQSGLNKLLTEAATAHPYTKRFEAFCRVFRKGKKGKKRRQRGLALKLIHALDGVESRRRPDIVQALLADPAGYKEDEVDDMIRRLHKHGLIRSVQGPYSKVTIN
jgi:hypothetical protein